MYPTETPLRSHVPMDPRGRLIRRLLVTLAIVWLSLATPLVARATTLEPMSVGDLSRRARDAFVGTVLSTAVENDADGSIRTAVTLRVSDRFKGRAGDVRTVYVPGGRTADGITAIVEDMPAFRVGETAFVFADERGWVMAGHQGKMGVTKGRVKGRPVDSMAAEVRAAVSGAPEPVVVQPESITDVLSPEPSAPQSLTAGTPVIASIDPGVVSAGTSTRVTITGSGFGDTRGRVSFYYQSGEPRIDATTIDSWSDARIVVVVPVATVNDYAASSGSGPVIVTRSDGVSSAGHTLSISFGNGLKRWTATAPAYPRTRVTYVVHPGGVARAEELVDVAARVWSEAGADFAFLDGGVSTASTGSWYDGRNDVSWSADVPAGVLAQAQSYTGGSGQIIESNVTFNTAYRWSDGTYGSMDIASIALHELGHWLSLRDLYGPGDTSKVMYGFAGAGTVKRTLTSGELAGIRWIYGVAPVAEPAPAPEPAPTPEPAPAPDPAPAPAPLPFPTPEPTIAPVPSATPTSAPVVRTSATLTRPSAPASARRYSRFTVRGYLKPHHASGSASVRVRFYRYESGRWVLRRIVTSNVHDYASYSRYAVAVSLSLRGRWRIGSYHADTLHEPSFSPYEYLSIR